MADHYILNGHEPVAVDLMTWARWLDKARVERTVNKTDIGHGLKISTVFLGLNHRFGDGPPLLFETLVFGGPLDGEQERYATWDEAEAGHARMVTKARASIAIPESEIPY